MPPLIPEVRAADSAASHNVNLGHPFLVAPFMPQSREAADAVPSLND